MPATSVPSSQHVRHYSAHTTAATARHVRDLTEAIRSGRVAEIEFLSSCVSRTASHDVPESDIDALFSALTEGVTTPFLDVRFALLSATRDALRVLPPPRIARHVLPLAHALRSLSGARPLLALAALISSASSLRALSDADALVSAVVDLAIVKLNGDGPVRPTLALALACLATAPNLLRPHVDSLRSRAEYALHSTCRATRETAIAVLARLPAAYSQKTRADALHDALGRTISSIEHVLVVLSQYCVREYLECTPDATEKELLAEFDEPCLLYRFESQCSLLTALLEAPQTIIVNLPLQRMVRVLSSALHLTTVDPISNPKEAPKLAPERVLAILPGIHASAVRSLPALLHAAGFASALPCAPDAIFAITDELLESLPSIRLELEDDAEKSKQISLAATSLRGQLYQALNAIARVTPQATLTAAPALATALRFDLDVLTELNAARKLELDGSGGRAPSATASGRRKKRARVGGAAVAAANAVARNSTPDACLAQGAHNTVLETVQKGINAAGALISAGALLAEQEIVPVRNLEHIVANFVVNQKQSAVQLSRAILSAGSAVAEAKASPLFWDALDAASNLHADATDGDMVHLAVDTVLHSRETHMARRAAADTIARSITDERTRVQHDPPLMSTSALDVDMDGIQRQDDVAMATPGREVRTNGASHDIAERKGNELDNSQNSTVGGTDAMQIVSEGNGNPQSSLEQDIEVVAEESSKPAEGNTQQADKTLKKSVSFAEENEVRIITNGQLATSDQEIGATKEAESTTNRETTEVVSDKPAPNPEPEPVSAPVPMSKFAEAVAGEEDDEDDNEDMKDEQEVLDSICMEASDTE